MHVISFALISAELRLADTVSELSQVFETGATEQHFIARSLLRSLQSSPVALESALARIKEASDRAVHSTAPLLDDSPEEELREDKPDGHPDFSVLAKADGI